MQVREIMSENVVCCTPDAPLSEVARLMTERDCGEIPVVDEQRRPIGVVTDRDIACRGVAAGKDPKTTTAREVMSQPVITVTPESSIERCCQLMEEKQIRRLVVTDGTGACCGIVAQADIARRASEHEVAEVLRDISRPAQEEPRAGL